MRGNRSNRNKDRKLKLDNISLSEREYINKQDRFNIHRLFFYFLSLSLFILNKLIKYNFISISI